MDPGVEKMLLIKSRVAKNVVISTATGLHEAGLTAGTLVKLLSASRY